MSFWLEYIHSCGIFVLENGAVLLLGTVLLLGHIRYVFQSDKKKNQFKTNHIHSAVTSRDSANRIIMV